TPSKPVSPIYLSVVFMLLSRLNSVTNCKL
ncbi:MAG: hypothetical protein ACI8WW_002858, partial [Oceanospirillaceae bacterium]